MHNYFKVTKGYIFFIFLHTRRIVKLLDERAKNRVVFTIESTKIPSSKPSRVELKHSSVLPLFCIVTQLGLGLRLAYPNPKHDDIDVL